MDRSAPHEVHEFVECIADGEPLAIPLARAGRWVQCTIAALPLAEPWVRGIAVFEDQVLVCLGMRPRPASAPRSAAGLVLEMGGLETGGDQRARWLVEVEQVLGMRRMRIRSRAGARQLVGEGETTDGRRISWLDVAALGRPTLTAPRARTA